MSEPARGRPRSERSRRAVLDATSTLLSESGYERLTIDGIATAAGVSRQTVYRWWPAKSAIVAEAVVEGVIALPSTPPAPTGHPLDDLRSFLRTLVATSADPANATLVRALAAAAADDAPGASTITSTVTAPTRDELASRIAAATAAGDVRASLDPRIAADALLGAVLFRTLAHIELTPEYADALFDGLLAR
ncbi:TetR/AcrR family transcriptional regulator [Agromyces protaetiae]|nr:TetR/AcrR family transcriptional regulator [Agromyces protaetiae]